MNEQFSDQGDKNAPQTDAVTFFKMSFKLLISMHSNIFKMYKTNYIFALSDHLFQFEAEETMDVK